MDTPSPLRGLRHGGRVEVWQRATPEYVVLDVDGTLLGPSGEPTPAVLHTVQRAAEAGLRLGFATGRMRAAVEPLGEILRLPGPHLFHNGALVRAEGETVASWPLRPEAAVRTLALCREHGWYAEVYVRDGYLVTDRREEAVVHWHMLHQGPDGYASELDADADEVLKITIAIFDGTGPAALETLRDAGLHVGAATSPLARGVTFVNVTDPGADKGRALRAAADHVGLELARIAAIGDGHNDLPMLAVAGTSIAMAQAPQEVRAASHLVTDDVETDGVVTALEACIAWRSDP